MSRNKSNLNSPAGTAPGRPSSVPSNIAPGVNFDSDVGLAGIPARNEQFVLKDLDTGMQSYVTDQEWVEKPIVPSPFLGDATDSEKEPRSNKLPPVMPKVVPKSDASVPSATTGKTKIRASPPYLSTPNALLAESMKTALAAPPVLSFPQPNPNPPMLSRRPPVTALANRSAHPDSEFKLKSDNVKTATTSNLDDMYFPQPPQFRNPVPSSNSSNSSSSLLLDKFINHQYPYRGSAPFVRLADQVRVLAHKKRDREFSHVFRWQRVLAHSGTILAMEFNSSGEWLATAGTDTMVKIWNVDTNLDDESNPPGKTTGFSQTRATSPSSSAPSSPRAAESSSDRGAAANAHQSTATSRSGVPGSSQWAHAYLRKGVPHLVCRGHTSDVTDVSWSKNDFLVSASLDGTVRLWHPRSKSCLRRLIHTDMLTSVVFHPTDETICISGCVNGNIYMWDVKQGECLSDVDTDDVVTSVTVTPDGTTGLVGTLHGRCKFYALFDEIQGEWQFKHTAQVEVRSKRARHTTGKKVCGFRFYGRHADKVLMSSNDSRLRLYRLDDYSVVCKLVGHTNYDTRLNGSFDPTGRFVACASEDRRLVLWDLHHGRSGDDIDDDFPGPVYHHPVDDGSDNDDDDDDDDEMNADSNMNMDEESIDTSGHLRPQEGGQQTQHNNQHQLYLSPPSQQQLQQRKDLGVAHESFAVQDGGHVTAATFAPKVIPRDALKARKAVFTTTTCGLVLVTASDDGSLRVFGCL